MKKIVTGSLLLLMATIALAQGQPRRQGPPKPPPLAARWSHDSTRLADALAPAAGQLDKMKSLFLGFYRNLDEAAAKSKEAPPPRTVVEKLVAQRSSAVQKLLTPAQAEKFKSLYKALMPPPPPPGQRMPAPPPAGKTR